MNAHSHSHSHAHPVANVGAGQCYDVSEPRANPAGGSLMVLDVLDASGYSLPMPQQ